MHALAATRVNRTYQSQTAQQIISDLAQQAGIDTGDLDSGSTYPYVLVHESRSLLDNICDLGRREGLDVYTDADNHLNAKAFSKSSADHVLYYGIDILDLILLSRPQLQRHVTIVGESPTSNNGSSTWPWIIKDPTSVTGAVGSGDQLLALRDGTVRSKDAADQFAKEKYGVLKDGASSGRVRLLGRPDVRVGEAIEIKSAPKDEMNGLFKVVAVRHVLSKRSGFVTWLEFTGQGGAQQAQSLLGGLAGKLAGALGL
jgi:hypothetical protein